MAATDKHSFGVFKPVDHVVISFATAEQADAAAQALADLGMRGLVLHDAGDDFAYEL